MRFVHTAQATHSGGRLQRPIEGAEQPYPVCRQGPGQGDTAPVNALTDAAARCFDAPRALCRALLLRGCVAGMRDRVRDRGGPRPTTHRSRHRLACLPCCVSLARPQAQWASCLCGVDAWLGRVIGCVAEVGHVRPRSSHATLLPLIACSLCAVYPGPKLCCPGRRTLSALRDDDRAIGGPASVPRQDNEPMELQ